MHGAGTQTRGLSDGTVFEPASLFFSEQAGHRRFVGRDVPFCEDAFPFARRGAVKEARILAPKPLSRSQDEAVAIGAHVFKRCGLGNAP